MKKCLIIANLFKKEAPELAGDIQAFLAEKSVKAEIFSYKVRTGREKLDCPFEGNDFTITLGGDGTVLFACRSCAKLGIPVFSVNLGEFGFLASVQVEDWKKELSMFLENKLPVCQRSLVACEVIRDGKTVFTSCGMNDVVISSPGSARLINLNVAYNHALLGPFKANGIIISTPTGSTAYSAAAGGPILDPLMEGLVLTPVSSFSLSARPLVFSSRGEIVITVLPSRVDISLCTDGQINFELKENDIIILGIPAFKALLAGASQEKFYAALQSKLNWSGGPRA